MIDLAADLVPIVEKCERAPMQRRLREVVEGQHYQKVGPGGGVWQIVAVRPDASGARHAKMQSLLEPTTFRTYALEAVLDLRNFRLVESPTGLSRGV